MAELGEVRDRAQRWLDVTSGMTPESKLADRVIQLEVAQRLGAQVILDFMAETIPQEKRKPRSPWTWPLVALGIIMVLAVGGTVLALVTTS